MKVKTSPDGVRLSFPEEPLLDELLRLEHARQRFSHLFEYNTIVMIGAIASVAIIRHLGHADDAALLLALYFMLLFDLAYLLVRRTIALRALRRTRDAWLRHVRKDPSWENDDTP